MTAPTEQEVREAIESGWPADANIGHGNDSAEEVLYQLITHVMADPFIDSAVDTFERNGGQVWEPLQDPHADAIWTDLRPLEARRLVELTREACQRAQERAMRVIVEELTAVGVQFAAEYPDAPRRKVEVAV